MAKIIITFNEIRQSSALANEVAAAVAAHTGQKKVCGPDLSDLNDAQLASKLRGYCTGMDSPFIQVGSQDLTIEVPEKFVVGYMKAYGKLVERVVPLGVQIYNIGKSVAGLIKVFQKDILDLAREVFKTKPDIKE